MASVNKHKYIANRYALFLSKVNTQNFEHDKGQKDFKRQSARADITATAKLSRFVNPNHKTCCWFCGGSA